jgi:hypothetical protein
MEITLRPFSVPAVVEEIRCVVALEATLVIKYRLDGDMTRIHWPGEECILTENTSELWRSTCFEYFIGQDAATGYFEFNQSPSGNGCGFEFEAYRQSPVASSRLIADSFFMARDESSTEIRLDVPVPPSPFLLGLAAIIEDTDGTLHYYAARHPVDAPDFHRRDHHHRINIEALS